jgi:hypothetical protein
VGEVEKKEVGVGSGLPFEQKEWDYSSVTSSRSLAFPSEVSSRKDSTNCLLSLEESAAYKTVNPKRANIEIKNNAD